MVGKDKKRVGVILLAAGLASRMGMPKQLMVYEQKPLIRHVLEKLLTLDLPITVVLGARAPMIRSVIEDLPVNIIVNKAWQEGMGGSMQMGLREHLTDEAVLLCVVDQPLLTTEILEQLLAIAKNATDATQVLGAARYQNDILGVPALFGQQWYDAMLNLPARVGARKLLRQYEGQVTEISFPDGDFDLDKPQDWEKFRRETE